MSRKDIERRKKFVLELMGDPIYQPMRFREISSLLRLSKEEKKDLYDVLDELCDEGKVSVDHKGRYEKVKGKWKKKKDDRHYDDRKDEYEADFGKKKKDKKNKDKNDKDSKDKKKDRDKEWNREKDRRKNRGRDFRDEREGYREEDLEGTPAEGTFIGHSKGFGFVEIEGQDEDIFIPEAYTGTAMHQDKVRIIILDGQKEGKRQEGVVVKVLERGMPEIVGTYQLNRDFGFVISDNPKFSKDIFIPRKEAAGVKNGDKVIATITDYGSKNKNPEGKIKENLGNIRTPGTDILAIVKSFGIPSEFPEKVQKQAQRVPDHVLDADRDGRLDLRHLQTVTIDGEDAKDLDDAISLSKEGGIYHLGVHIADVSNYVQYNSALDREALKRGTSVYLADRVVPMLPERLSNGICSLNQGEDRLALSCLMDINEKGKVVSHQIAETVINVNERMCYTDVKNILEDTDEEAKKRYDALIPMFFMMKELSGILRNSRHHRGSIDFDFPESKIILNAAGKAIDVKPYEANVATKIIEDFMLMANETVAQEYCTEEIPFVYRTHDNPDPEKVESLLTLLHNQGVKIQKAKEEITPKEIQQIIESIEGLPNEAMISRLVLRSMKQAKYTTGCEGHFGLAMKYYCHFTSPIRRYPDLQIHRIIKENLHGALTDKRISHYEQILPEVTAEASRLERRADDAEREVEKMKKAEYMEQFIGETFDGVISGVTSWGMYVELPNTIEGMVRVADIPGDYYYFEEERYQMVGEKTGKIYKLGQKVRVTVSAVDKLLRTIDFELNEEDENEHGEETDRK